MPVTRDDLLAAAAIAVPTGAGFIRGFCPFCEEDIGFTPEKRNFAIRKESGWYRCWRCCESGFIRGLDEIIFQEEIEQDTDTLEEPEKEFELPREFVSMASKSARHSRALSAAFKFVRGRGVKLATVRDAGLGATLRGYYKYSVVVPIYDRGFCRGYVARRVFEKVYLYPRGMKRGQVMFNMDALSVKTDEPCIIVEGCFDALPHWPLAVAVLGKPSAAHEEMLANAKRPLAICLDADAQRQGWALAARLTLKGVRAEYLELPPGTDPGETSRAWMERKIIELF